MKRIKMSEELLKDIYHVRQFDANEIEHTINFGKISDKDKFVAAKQILLGLAILYVLTLIAFLLRPDDSQKLIDITMTIFPPLATLILVFYFKEK
jgi:hypothetical protein